jgi:hypothetical protein
MAATAPFGISNSQEDDITFTKDWCRAFKKLMTKTCVDLINEINAGPKLEQYGRSVFVIEEGWNLPMTF